jgi:hypothetical protein
MEKKPTAAIHPKFAEQIEDMLCTLEERFHFKLECITRELAANEYESPELVIAAVTNFIGGVRGSDCIARSDVLAYNRLSTDCEQTIKQYRVYRQPERASA